MSDLFGRFPGWLVLIWGRPCVRRSVVRPADVCCGVAGRRDASGAFASCRSINSRPLFSSFSDHLPASPPALLCPFAGPSPNFSRVFSALLQLPSSPRPVPVQSPSSPRPVPVRAPSSPSPDPFQALSRPFPGPFQALPGPFETLLQPRRTQKKRSHRRCNLLFLSRIRDLTSLRSSFLCCLPQGRFRKSASLREPRFAMKKPPANCFAAVFP